MINTTPVVLRRLLSGLALSIGLAGVVGPAWAADLAVRVTDVNGQPLANAAIMADWPGAPAASGADQTAEVTQRHLKFHPHVLVVARNTSVIFPNYDRTRHQVYSFSPAKTFNLKLYVGRPQRPIVFDKTGVVTLGCAIHDYMQAFIVVTDKPRWAVTNDHGRAVLSGLPDNKTVRLAVWHPEMPSDDWRVQRTVNAGVTSIHIRLDVKSPEKIRRDDKTSLQARFNQLAQ